MRPERGGSVSKAPKAGHGHTGQREGGQGHGGVRSAAVLETVRRYGTLGGVLASLCLGFPSCEVEMVIVPVPYGSCDEGCMR